MSNFTTNRVFVLLLMAMALGGCSWFSWLPWVDDEAKVNYAVDDPHRCDVENYKFIEKIKKSKK